MCSFQREKNVFIEILLNDELPMLPKIRQKISKEAFTMLNYRDYNMLLNVDYNLSQLKQINKQYKQKISGNKYQLQCRIYNFLKYSYDVLRIQKCWKGYKQRQLNKLRGPAFMNRGKCVNESDFFTLESCADIPTNQFFSFKDNEGFTYGFNILSIYTLFIKNGNINVENPYNKKILGTEVLEAMRGVLKICKFMKIYIDTSINNNDSKSEPQKFSMRVLSLFQMMDSLGNYTQLHWFTSLSKNSLLKYIRDIYDIWSYRAQLSQNVKRDICPPHGNPFRSVNIGNLPMMNFNLLQLNVLYIMEQFVKSGITTANKTLGAFYVLSALTLVNKDAAEAMPWLYDSVLPV
jgi:hypothetical protein